MIGCYLKSALEGTQRQQKHIDMYTQPVIIKKIVF